MEYLRKSYQDDKEQINLFEHSARGRDSTLSRVGATLPPGR